MPPKKKTEEELAAEEAERLRAEAEEAARVAAEEAERVENEKWAPTFVFKDLPKDATLQLMATDSPADCHTQLAKLYCITDYNEQLRSGVTMDLLLSNILFAKKAGWTATKVSGFFTLMKRVHEHCVLENKLSMEDAFNVFKAWLLKHTVTKPPDSVKLFTLLDVQELTTYVKTTYFQHYQLYLYCYSQEQEADLYTKALYVQTARPPLPLSLAHDTTPARPADHTALETAEDGGEQATDPATQQADDTAATEEPAAEPEADLLTKEGVPVKMDDIRQFIQSSITHNVMQLKNDIKQHNNEQGERLLQRVGELVKPTPPAPPASSDAPAAAAPE